MSEQQDTRYQESGEQTKTPSIQLDPIEPVTSNLNSLNLSPPLPSDLKDQSKTGQNPSPSNFAVTQNKELMHSKPDPRKPLGEPQLVGLTSITYSSSDLDTPVYECTLGDLKNSLIEQTIEHYYEEPKKLKGVAKGLEQSEKEDTLQLIQQARLSVEEYKILTVGLSLPFPMLVEQLQLQLPGQEGSKKSQYSKQFKLLSVKNQNGQPVAVKNAFSEGKTKKGLVEVNLCAVVQQVTLTFLCVNKSFVNNPSPKKSKNITDLDNEVALISKMQDPVSPDQIDIQVASREEIERQLAEDEMEFEHQAFERGILNDDEDDLRILDSLPNGFKPTNPPSAQKVAPEKKEEAPKEKTVFQQCVSSIKVIGFNTNSIPAITNLTYFMNQAFYLRREDREEEAQEIDFLVCTLLITTKRSTQAAEMLRRLQLKETKSDQQNCEKMAVYELLAADSLSVETHLNEKMHALVRVAQFSKGQKTEMIRFSKQIWKADDSFSQMLRVKTDLLRFCILCLTHRREIVKISALKTIKFILENQGCSLDFAMVFILKGMLQTFPVQTPEKPNKDIKKQLETIYGSFELQKFSSVRMTASPPSPEQPGNEPTPYETLNEPASGFRQALCNIYGHVLDTFISVLSSISSHILHSIFYEVIEPTLTDQISQPSDQNFNLHLSKQSSATQKQIEVPGEIKGFACKIAEKIITICQGDLLISHSLMHSLLESYYASPKLFDSMQSQASLKNLWQSIRQKVFPNYSTKGFRQLVDWLLIRLTRVQQRKVPPVPEPKSEEQKEKEHQLQFDLSDEETSMLVQICEIITIVAIGRQKTEEDANQLIKLPASESFGGGSSTELNLLLPALVFWLEYAVDRDDRLHLFQQVYTTLKDVLEAMPQNKVELNVLSFIMPTLERVLDFLKGNSPSLNMLKFLDIVLTDIQMHLTVKPNRTNFGLTHDLQLFFLELLSNFVSYMSYSLYEEVFSVFEKLLYLASDVLTERVIKKCIVALVDKYTLKSKAHKSSMTSLVKILMEVKVRNSTSNPTSASRSKRNQLSASEDFEDMINENEISIQSKNQYFEIMSDFCFFNNQDIEHENEASLKHELEQLDFRGALDLHELFIDKLQFFINSLALMNDLHINQFTNLITHPNFKGMLIKLLEHGEIQIRMKCHEILESLTTYFVQYCPSKTVYEFADRNAAPGAGDHEQNEVMDAEFISHERLYISQIVIQIARKSLEQSDDCYLQFNALILLDYLFQNLLPVPTFHNEQVKARKQNKNSTDNNTMSDPLENEITMDIEALSISEATPELDVMDPAYLRMRMKLVLSLWPHIQAALVSPWSNIRSICYGLICSMLKVDVADFPNNDALSGGAPLSSNGGMLSMGAPLSSVGLDEQHNLSGGSAGLSDILSVTVATFNRLKEIVLPMLYTLLSSKESESKAGGLNILGSFCGLSYDFTGVKVHKHLNFFIRNSQFVGLPIWKLVYQLQDDWDITIKEASVVLVQLCAPRNAISYFQSLKDQKQKQKMDHMMFSMPKSIDIYSEGQSKDLNMSETSMLLPAQTRLIGKNKFAAKAWNFQPTMQDREILLEHDQAYKQSLDYDMTQDQISFKEFLGGRRVIIAPEQITCQQLESEHFLLQELVTQFKPDYEDPRSLSKPMSRKRQLEIELNLSKPQSETDNVNFFVDTYSDDQIQEIISIFRNDFKPPKNLWIEKQPNMNILGSTGSSNQQQNMGSTSPDFYGEIFSDAIEQFNQQQLQLQQQQQAQLQQQVSSGSSLSSQSSTNSDGSPEPAERHPRPGSNSPSKLDQMEEDMVKRLEQEHKRKSASVSPQDQSNSDKGSADKVKEEDPEIKKSESLEEIKPRNDEFKYMDASDSNSGSNHSSADRFNGIPNSGGSSEQRSAVAGSDPILVYESQEGSFAQKQFKQVVEGRICHMSPPHFPAMAQMQNIQSSPKKKASLQIEQIVFEDLNKNKKPKKLKKESLTSSNTEERDNHHCDQQTSQVESRERLVPLPQKPKKSTKRQRSADQKLRKKDKAQEDYPRKNNQNLELEDINFYNKDEVSKTLTSKNQNQDDSRRFDPLQNPQASNSTPEFIRLQAAYAQDVNGAIRASGTGGGDPASVRNLSGSGGSGSGDNRISRKMAQTYLAGLSKGYISNIDNIKLINNCLNTTTSQPKVINNENSYQILSQSGVIPPSAKPKKLNKSFENLNNGNKLSIKTASLVPDMMNVQINPTYQSTRSQKGKKTTLSTSPKRSKEQQPRKSSKSNKQRLQKMKEMHQTNSETKGMQPGLLNSSSNAKQLNNLADLNFFIKTIEKDLSEKFKNMKDFNSVPTTPNAILKKVEDHMRAIGYDKSVNVQNLNVKQDEKKRKQHMPPKIKQLALNQIKAHSIADDNQTPSSVSMGSNLQFTGQISNLGAASARAPLNRKSSPGKVGDPEFAQTVNLDKQGLFGSQKMGLKLGTHRSEKRDRSADTQTGSNRGANSSGSGSVAVNYNLPQPIAIMTERSQRQGKSGSKQKDSHTVRFQHNSNASKSLIKVGGSALSKSKQGHNSVLSPSKDITTELKKHKINKSCNQIASNKSKQKQLIVNMADSKKKNLNIQSSSSGLQSTKGKKQQPYFGTTNNKGNLTNRYSSKDASSMLYELIKSQESKKKSGSSQHKSKHSKSSNKYKIDENSNQVQSQQIAQRNEFSPISPNVLDATRGSYQLGQTQAFNKQQKGKSKRSHGRNDSGMSNNTSHTLMSSANTQSSAQQKQNVVPPGFSKPPMLLPTQYY